VKRYLSGILLLCCCCPPILHQAEGTWAELDDKALRRRATAGATLPLLTTCKTPLALLQPVPLHARATPPRAAPPAEHHLRRHSFLTTPFGSGKQRGVKQVAGKTKTARGGGSRSGACGRRTDVALFALAANAARDRPHRRFPLSLHELPRILHALPFALYLATTADVQADSSVAPIKHSGDTAAGNACAHCAAPLRCARAAPLAAACALPRAHLPPPLPHFSHCTTPARATQGCTRLQRHCASLGLGWRRVGAPLPFAPARRGQKPVYHCFHNLVPACLPRHARTRCHCHNQLAHRNVDGERRGLIERLSSHGSAYLSTSLTNKTGQKTILVACQPWRGAGMPTGGVRGGREVVGAAFFSPPYSAMPALPT